MPYEDFPNQYALKLRTHILFIHIQSTLEKAVALRSDFEVLAQALAGLARGEGKLVDLTLAGAKPEIVSGTIERLLADPANDAAIFVVGSSAQFNPELAVEPLVKFARTDKPFAVALTPAAEKSLALLTAAGVPAFRHPESCAEAMALCLLRVAPQAEAVLPDPSGAAST